MSDPTAVYPYFYGLAFCVLCVSRCVFLSLGLSARLDLNRVCEAGFGFNDTGLKLDVTRWVRGSRNQSYKSVTYKFPGFVHMLFLGTLHAVLEISGFPDLQDTQNGDGNPNLGAGFPIGNPGIFQPDGQRFSLVF